MKAKFTPYTYSLEVKWDRELVIDDLKAFNDNVLKSLKNISGDAQILAYKDVIPDNPAQSVVAIASGDIFLAEVSKGALAINTKYSIRSEISSLILLDVLKSITKVAEFSDLNTEEFAISGTGYVEAAKRDESEALVKMVQGLIYRSPYDSYEGFDFTFLGSERVEGHLLNAEKQIRTVRDGKKYLLELNVSYTHTTAKPLPQDRLFNVANQLLDGHDMLIAGYDELLKRKLEAVDAREQ